MFSTIRRKKWKRKGNESKNMTCPPVYFFCSPPTPPLCPSAMLDQVKIYCPCFILSRVRMEIPSFLLNIHSPLKDTIGSCSFPILTMLQPAFPSRSKLWSQSVKRRVIISFMQVIYWNLRHFSLSRRSLTGLLVLMRGKRKGPSCRPCHRRNRRNLMLHLVRQ
jgi:hypothetical protein